MVIGQLITGIIYGYQMMKYLPFKDFFTVSGLENKKIKKFNSNYNSIQDNYYNIPLIIYSSIETTDLIKENQKNIFFLLK